MTSAEVVEPDRKRVRFDQSIAEKEKPEPSSATPSKRHVLRANDVVELRFITHPDDTICATASHPEKHTTHPTYLHQIIPNEEVLGWHHLIVAVYVHTPSLSFWIDCHGTKLDDASDLDPPTDVPALLTPFIKSGLCATRTQFLAAAAATSSIPISNRIMTYTRANDTYAVYKEKFFFSEDNFLNKRISFLNFHLRMAFLMFIHIDGASFIDHDDPRWEVFVVARVEEDKPISFVGYATTYPFSALATTKGKPVNFAERIRISQVFILPVCQATGHGGQLLSAIYEDASARKAMEVTVEDPSRSFRILRDISDLKRCYNASFLDVHNNFHDAKEHQIVQSLNANLFLTKGQARRCLEVHRLRHTDRQDEHAYKIYRLWVKRRLYTENIEVLHQFEGQERKDKLAEIYSDFQEEYLEAIKRLEGSLKRAVDRPASDQKEQSPKLSPETHGDADPKPESEDKPPETSESKEAGEQENEERAKRKAQSEPIAE